MNPKFLSSSQYLHEYSIRYTKRIQYDIFLQPEDAQVHDKDIHAIIQLF